MIEKKKRETTSIRIDPEMWKGAKKTAIDRNMGTGEFIENLIERNRFPNEANGVLLRENKEIKKFNKIFFRKEESQIGFLAEGESFDKLPKIMRLRGVIINEALNREWLYDSSLILIIETENGEKIKVSDIFFNSDESGNIEFDAKIINATRSPSV
jgi:hypothetical protein